MKGLLKRSTIPSERISTLFARTLDQLYSSAEENYFVPSRFHPGSMVQVRDGRWFLLDPNFQDALVEVPRGELNKKLRSLRRLAGPFPGLTTIYGSLLLLTV